MSKFSIGVDFGTLSARAVLLCTENGKELSSSEFVYPHAVMDKTLPDGTPLEKLSAYQHPQDYLDALSFTVSDVLKKAEIKPEEVVGIGIDFTSCTVLPVDEYGTPLCFYDEFKSEPHAYVKLWKHHSAQKEADEITEKAIKNKEEWLASYGGKVSSEWLFPKILETLRKAPEVYKNAARFVEAGDWLTSQLTGSDVLSSCMAGYKGMWNKKTGYPSKDFLKTITPEFENIIGAKISENVKPTGTKAGEVSAYGSELTGLNQGTAVSVPIIDAHAALPSAGISRGGQLMLIIGTSSCHIIMDEEEKNISGICGMVRDGVLPSLVAYEAGQAAVGDIFDWFIKNNVPYSYVVEAEKQNKDIYEFLTEKAKNLKAGESDLIALDWWNGNRTPYANYDLKGAIFGYTLKTKPEEIYKALIEATAFGTKAIIDLYENNGIVINEIYATGGISQKNEFLMQIYADVLGRSIKVPFIKQAGATGCAIFASFAGGAYPSVKEAILNMVNSEEKTYIPDSNNTFKYNELYKKYLSLSEYFANQNKSYKKDI